MDKRIKIPIIVAAVILLAYPLLVWATGFVVEARWQRTEEQSLQRVAAITVVKRTYHRGVFGATEELTLGYGRQILQLASAAPLTQELSTARLTLRNTIHNGPLPGLRTVAMATIDTELLLPPELQKQLDALLKGKPALTIHTRVGWSGARKTEVSSPAFNAVLSDGAMLASRGITAVFAAGRDLESATYDVTAPGLSVREQRLKAEFRDFHAAGTTQTRFAVVDLGKVSATLAAAHFEPAAGGTSFSLQDLAIDSTSSLHEDFVDMQGSLSVAAFQIGKFAASNFGYSFSATHIYGPALGTLIQEIRTASGGADMSAAASTQTQQTFVEAFRKDGTEILLHDPVIELSRIGFMTPEGKFHVSAKLTAPGLKRADLLATAPDRSTGIAQHLLLVVDLRVDAALQDKLLEGNANRDKFIARTEALERAGILKRADAALTAHIVFAQGKLTVNGQPYPPAAPRLGQPN